MQYVTVWERMGIEQGLQQGLEQGRQTEALTLTLRLLQRKVGTLNTRVEKRIRKLPLEKIEQLSEALLDFTTPRDLNTWMKEHAQ